jgi:predicted AAA+ superfamily ATPase
MNYRPRYLQEKLRELSPLFGAILVTGPRQAGKTWLLTHTARALFGEEVQTVAFDTPTEMDAFRRDPELFFANRPGVLFLDEVQHVPEIFPYLKREIDRAPGTFRFLLSGSQHFDLMKGVTESLAGRAAVLDLWPFAVQEARSGAVEGARATIGFFEDPTRLDSLLGREFPANDGDDVVPAMLTGGYPRVALWSGGSDWLEAYRRTYLQRDIRQLSQVGDLGRFDRFVVLCAGRSGTVLNKAEMGRTLGVDHKTIDHWLSLLETSFQIISIPAHHATATKRLVRRSKWVFGDIGLGLHLQGVRDAPGLLNAPHFGSLFESFVLMELRKLYAHLGRPWDARFWRTPKGLECDLVLPAAGQFLPVEIKHTASPRQRDGAPLATFLEDPTAAPVGILISLHPRVEKLTRRIYNLPLGLLLNGPN